MMARCMHGAPGAARATHQEVEFQCAGRDTLHVANLQAGEGNLSVGARARRVLRTAATGAHPQRADADRVRQILVLLAARTQRKLVHEVRRDCKLSLRADASDSC